MDQRRASPIAASAAANPVMVEVVRGGTVESRHRGRAVVVDAQGAIVLGWGAAEEPVFPRSAVKSIQALPLIETGAADASDASDAEIALACASHGGEPRHTESAARWLARLGLGEGDLECGPHAPSHAATNEALVRAGQTPCRLHNNCSGKHTGFLAVARRLGVPTRGYSRADHPVQALVTAALADMAGVPASALPVGVDGCGVPTLGVPLAGLARMMARMADPSGLAPARRKAVERIRRAIAAHPGMVAGEGRLCTALIAATGGRVLVKTGAEGVFTAALPAKGWGVALKIDDGGSRASEVAIIALLRRLGALEEAEAASLAAFADPGVVNTQGRRVGDIRATLPG